MLISAKVNYAEKIIRPMVRNVKIKIVVNEDIKEKFKYSDEEVSELMRRIDVNDFYVRTHDGEVTLDKDFQGLFSCQVEEEAGEYSGGEIHRISERFESHLERR